jgi:tetrahydrodipicolinate N-succinyltransferase
LTRVSSDKKLLIIGAGQYGMVAKETAESMNCFEQIDFLDDNNPIAVGKIVQYEEFVGDYKYAIVAIGNSGFRLELTEKLRNAGYTIATIICPLAYVSKSAVINEGCIVEAMSVVNTESVIDKCCFISAGAVVNHNSVIGEGCHIDCHATVRSNAVVEAKTKVEYGQVYV